ncbi:complement C1q-like protein 4 [Megalobrama amblycephala]|uniref:complement C1q-like protein 4 n=1 Tax=Megalobrama amblycephala TaxID=75352 RepID=UPI0020147C39|nr:complement C1q-like protein 4 [Megalobrama amblycephala]
MVVDEWHNNGPQDLVTVSQCIQNPINKMHLCLLSITYACPYHNPTATMGLSIHNADISKPLTHKAQYTLSALYSENRDSFVKRTPLQNREIAFSASLMQSGSGYTGPFTTDITLTYKNVFTNIGNAYNPITGIFTAPLKGAYMFRVSIYGHAPNTAGAFIYKNGERVVTAYDIQDQGRTNSSNGVLLILEVGDVVYVKLGSGRRIYDNENNHNTFSGFLLFPLR